MNKQHLRYSMLIEWSNEDQAYLVILPEWADHVMMPVTHGETYGEAVRHGQEVLEMLVKSALQEGESLPTRWPDREERKVRIARAEPLVKPLT